MKIVIPDDTHIISEEVMECPSSCKHVEIFLKNKAIQNDSDFNACDLSEVAKLRERVKNGNGK